MPVQIPADLTIVTLRNAGRVLPQRFTPSYARTLLANASELLRVRADIAFRLGTCEQVTEEMPASVRGDVVDEAGYHFLAAAHRARTGVRVLFVDRVSRTELGGQARHQTGVCLVSYWPDTASTSRMLAHELGHLLELPHIDDRSRQLPGNESEVAAWARNLMNSGALGPDAELNPDQVRQARASALARRFGSS